MLCGMSACCTAGSMTISAGIGWPP